jgi:hypothetical protein
VFELNRIRRSIWTGIGVRIKLDLTFDLDRNHRSIPTGLCTIKLTEKDGYFIYPNYLKKDEEIIEIKKYLQERLR